MTTTNTATQAGRLRTIKQFVAEGHYPSEAGIRHHIFWNTNAFVDKVVKRIGRRILLDIDAFYKWVN